MTKCLAMENRRFYLLGGMVFENFGALENQWDEFLAWQTGAPCQHPGAPHQFKTFCKSYT